MVIEGRKKGNIRFLDLEFGGECALVRLHAQCKLHLLEFASAGAK
jgi:hypothetical protein